MDRNDLNLYDIDMSQSPLFQGETVSASRVLYTPSSFAKENLFYLQETGRLTAEKVHTSRRDYLDSCLFLLVESGSGTVTCEQTDYELHAGDAIFLDCRTPYSHQSSSDLWTLRWVHFSGSAMNAIYRKFRERSGSPFLHVKEPAAYDARFAHLLEVSRSDSYVRDMELHETLSALLTMIMKDCWKEPDSAESGTLSRLVPIRDYLQEHCTEPITLDALSSRFYINKYYLTRIFRMHYGTTILDYLLELRINRAKQLLRFTDETLQTISAECGFSDQAYFSRRFKNAEGISPSAFRRQWGQSGRSAGS